MRVLIKQQSILDDGLYVVGKNMLVPVNNEEEGQEIIKQMKRKELLEDETKDGHHS